MSMQNCGYNDIQENTDLYRNSCTGISSSKILCSVFFYTLVAWTNINFECMVQLKLFLLLLNCILYFVGAVNYVSALK